MNNSLPELGATFFFTFILMAGMSIAGLALFIERLFLLRKMRGSIALSETVNKLIEEGRIAEAEEACQESKAAVAPLLQVALVKREERRESIEKAIELQGALTLSEIEKYCRTLSLIATIAPLLGLLGTTLGFLNAFQQIGESAFFDVATSGISESVGFALATTALGLVIAIPALCGYQFLVHKIEEIALLMRKCTFSLLETLCKKEWNRGY